MIGNAGGRLHAGGRFRGMAVGGSFLILGLLAAGCDVRSSKVPPLEGERIPVMALPSDLTGGSTSPHDPIVVIAPEENADWPMVGGSPGHASYHLALGPDPRQIFRVSAGTGSSRDRHLLAEPVIDSRGHVYVLDSRARLSVFDGEDGRRLWQKDLRPRGVSDGTLGAGLALGEGRLVVTTGFAEVIALDTQSREELWRKTLSAPIRSAPTIADGKAFVVSSDNRTFAFDLRNGEEIWSHRGSPEQSSLLGGAAPAHDAGVVVVAYSSGEVFGLGAAGGRVLWNEFLARPQRTSAIGRIADIRASPVIDRGTVFIVGNAGLMTALGLSNGLPLWRENHASPQMPWAAGRVLYLVTNENQLLAINRSDGRVLWSHPLPRFQDPDRRRGWITWTAPVLAGDRLIIAGSNREILAISPYLGDTLGRIRLPAGVSVAPIVARGTLYVLTDDADLIAFR